MPVQCTCEHCGTPFVARLTEVKKGYGRYCSQPCYWATLRASVERTVTACGSCGAAIDHLVTEPRRFCSHACKGKGLISNIRSYAPTGYDGQCEVCGTPFRVTKRRRGRFCSSACWGQWLSESGATTGENNSRWRGGPKVWYGASWPYARRACRHRDKVCQGCGVSSSQTGRALDVHHLIPFRTFGPARHLEANRLENLVALCQVCHMKREWGTNWGTRRRQPLNSASARLD